MMVQAFKSAVGHSIFGASVTMHRQAQWIWTWEQIAMSDSQAFWGCSLLCLWFGHHQCLNFGRRKPLIVHIHTSFMRTLTSTNMMRSTDHVCKCKERYHPTPPQPHPTPWCCVAPTMCASARNMMLRSTNHACKCKKHDVCIAPTMCASARNVIIPTPPHPNPTPPHYLRSINRVVTSYIYINTHGAGVPGEPPAPRIYIYICTIF